MKNSSEVEIKKGKMSDIKKYSYICTRNRKETEIMALNTNKNVKLYYSIREVAQQFGINESTLRYWETEFPDLKPKTVGQNVRQYTQKDIDQISVIYNLVKVRGFKLSAARKMMHQNRQGVDRSADVLSTLTAVRDELKELKHQLDQIV